ncbi:hypothetical protein GCM10027189_32910 [Rufibacter soli]
MRIEREASVKEAYLSPKRMTMKRISKNIAKMALAAFAVASLAFTACGEGPAENTGTTSSEDMVEGADGGIDSVSLPADTTKNH